VVAGKDDKAVTYVNSKTGFCCLRIVHDVNRLIDVNDTDSVYNVSAPLLWVRVRVQTKTLPNWRLGCTINSNCQFGYGSMDIHNPSELGWLSVGCPVGQFVDSYNALVIAA
jgi:hypothetical protein